MMIGHRTGNRSLTNVMLIDVRVIDPVLSRAGQFAGKIRFHSLSTEKGEGEKLIIIVIIN